MSRPIITLRPLTSADLAAITPWCEDPDTDRPSTAAKDQTDRSSSRRSRWRPGRSRSAPITIEVLYFDGCPNHEELLTRLPQLLEHEAINAEIVLCDIPDVDTAIKERFLGSPTVRVNGHDVDPDAGGRDDYGLKCRIFRTATGLTGLPPDRWILDAIAAHTAFPLRREANRT